MHILILGITVYKEHFVKLKSYFVKLKKSKLHSQDLFAHKLLPLFFNFNLKTANQSSLI